MKLNEKIYEYRKINRWSQEELADRLKVSRQTISK
ncbi:helix-turn-helix transcriptional regulator, partial [Klebsiella pneumoniae]